MATDYDVFKLLVAESLSPAVLDLTLPDDDITWEVMQTFEAKEMNGGRDLHNSVDAVTAGYFYDWRILRQRGGAVEGGTFGGNTIDTVGPDSTYPLNVGADPDDLYPDPVLTPGRSYIPVRMKLKRFRGNVRTSREDFVAQLVGNTIEDVAASHIEDAVWKVRHHITDQIHSDGGGRYARADGAYTIQAGSATAVTIKEGQYTRFVKGDKYVAASTVTLANYGSSQRTLRTGTSNPNGIMYCVDVDIDDRTLYLQAKTGSGNISITDGDDLLPYGFNNFAAANVTAGARAIEGFESLIREAGNFPATTLAVTDHRELKGMVVGDEDNKENPTPELIDEIIDKISDSGKRPPNLLISEKSVKTLYNHLERQGGAQYQVPQGATFVASGGVSGPRYGKDNVDYTWVDSAKTRPGSVIGIATDTWSKAMPTGDRAIQWLYADGGASGLAGVFSYVHSGRQESSLAQAPFDAFCEVCCTDPRRNFRRIGFNSQRDQ